ncbi:MAG: hypothetical protein PWQ63_1675 [Methanolobus sp.]|jgi:hypothetical protein|nr:hypothetical protein [Methanolobus sp.]
MTENKGPLPAPITYNTGIAELLSVHYDVSNEKIEKSFPYLNKAMQTGNLTDDEILNIKDDLLILNIIKRSKMTRGEKIRAYDRGDFIETRSLLTAGLSLARNGKLMERLTGMYQHIETSDNNASQPVKRGMFGQLLGGSGK